jgi:type IV pilus secretin PilQ/predicted competence protein
MTMRKATHVSWAVPLGILLAMSLTCAYGQSTNVATAPATTIAIGIANTPTAKPQAEAPSAQTPAAAPAVVVVQAGGTSSNAPAAVEAPKEEAPQPISDFVTVNVSGGSMADVLNAFSRQTGKSIVLGPEVTNSVTLRLNNTPWEEALDVILKPYGYGFKKVGETIVVKSLREMAAEQQDAPLMTEVFNLRFVDASDILEIVQKQLSPRGVVSVLTTQVEKGWQFESQRTGSAATVGGAGVGEKRQRIADETRKSKSKTIVVKDAKESIEAVRKVLEAVDSIPRQILIEARFVEINSSFLRDIGVQWGTGANGATSLGVTPQSHGAGGQVYGIGAQASGGDVTPAAFGPQSGATMNDRAPFNAGMALQLQQLTGVQFDLLMHMLQEDDSLNILSAPRVLTLNNQEATINVGTKFPIIQSQVSGGGTGSSTVSTTLEYYENIGIQLNVVPQVCGESNVNLIVHPVVTDQIGTEGGVVVPIEGTSVPLTRYPILSTREAETQIILQSGSTVVIGGLLKKREARTQLKTPFLASIPIIGLLFRRDTADNDKMDLLIFLTATIMPTSEQQSRESDLTRTLQETQRMMKSAGIAQAQAEQAMQLEKTAHDTAEKRVQEEAKALARAESEIANARAERQRLIKEKAEESARRASAEKQTREAVAAKAAAERKAKEEAEARLRAQHKKEADARALTENGRKDADAAAKARLEAEKEKQAKAANEAEKARLAREEGAAARAAEEAASKAKAEKARIAAEKKARAEAEEQAKEEAKARSEAEEVRKAEAVRQAEAALAVEKARLLAQEKARKEAEARAEEEREARAKAEKEAEKARLRAEKEAKAKAAAEAEAKAEAAKEAEKARLTAERKAREEAEAKAEADKATQAKAAREAEKTRVKAAKEAEKTRLAAERKAREEAEAKAEAEADAKARAEKERLAAEKKAKAEAEMKAEAEEAARQAAEKERKAKLARQAKAAKEAELARQKAEAMAREAETARIEAERKAKEAAAEGGSTPSAAAESEAKGLIEKLPDAPASK